MKDEEQFCHYCFKQTGTFYTLWDWRQSGLSTHFCYEHYVMARDYQNSQKRRFMKYFKELNDQIDVDEKKKS